MINVRYRGGIGNRLFQYCFGRILAESLGWRLECRAIDGFPGTKARIHGKSFPGPTILYGPRANVDLPATLSDPSPRKIVVSGWLQKYDYYRDHAASIKCWLEPAASPAGRFPIAGPDDLVLHLRIGPDYESRRWVLHPQFYESILQRRDQFDKVYICYDLKKKPSDRMREACLAPLARWNPHVFESGDPMTDFNFVRQFRNIAIAPSTFCWWAAYLSNARAIYFPDLRSSRTSCWRRRRPVDYLRPEVDEPRYVYSPAKTLWD